MVDGIRQIALFGIGARVLWTGALDIFKNDLYSNCRLHVNTKKFLLDYGGDFIYPNWIRKAICNYTILK